MFAILLVSMLVTSEALSIRQAGGGGSGKRGLDEALGADDSQTFQTGQFGEAMGTDGTKPSPAGTRPPPTGTQPTGNDQVSNTKFRNNFAVHSSFHQEKNRWNQNGSSVEPSSYP